MTLNLPLFVLIPRKTKEDKKIILNMNCYRNLHHMTNNQAKVIYKNSLSEAMRGSVWSLASLPPYRFTYTLFQASNRRTDIANVLSIVDKFTCDALVELGIIEDDNNSIISELVYRYGGVDKNNPRAELKITTINEEDK